MTVTAPLPAAPEACSERLHGVEGRSSLTRTITMKLLKHAGVDTPDTLASLMRITARGAAQIHSQISLCLHVVLMTAAGLTTVGVLITLYVAIFFERRSAEALHSASGTCTTAGHSAVGKVGADHVVHRIA